MLSFINRQLLKLRNDLQVPHIHVVSGSLAIGTCAAVGDNTSNEPLVAGAEAISDSDDMGDDRVYHSTLEEILKLVNPDYLLVARDGSTYTGDSSQLPF